MIDANKPSKTRCGYPVRIYATDGGGTYSVHGAYFRDGTWYGRCWNAVGQWVDGCRENDLDLIEVKPVKTMWLNVHTDHVSVFASRADADNRATLVEAVRVACVEVTYTEGQGLE